MSLPTAPVCPHCQQRAPIRLSGVTATCAICHSARSPFNTNTINLAGKPQQIGGLAARVAGWLGFATGTFFSIVAGALVALLGDWLVGSPTPGYVIGATMWALTLAFSLTAIIGGRKLGQHGKQKALHTQFATVRALAQHHGGCVTIADAARSLGVAPAEADALLSQLAQDPQEDIVVDLDDDGTLLYLFGGSSHVHRHPRWLRMEEQLRARIETTEPRERASEEAALGEAEAEPKRSEFSQ